MRILCNTPLSASGDFTLRCFGDYPSPAEAGRLQASIAGPPHDGHWRAEFERRSMPEILAAIPAEEQPQILVISSPEYLPTPWDLHAFPGPKVLLITDWNVCLRFLPDFCPLFDYCFTDWPGYRLLRKIGVDNVYHQPLFGHHPANFRTLGLERDLDISFCGNFNTGLHSERNKLVVRVHQWAQRAGRRAHLEQAFGDEYIKVLNRSRMVFNYSIRGEANMRLYETMAGGAAALVEQGNVEVPLMFQEGVHYFGYDPERLEDRLDELLADPDRVAAVAEAGRREVAKHTNAKQIGAVLEKVMAEEEWLAGGAAAAESKGGVAVAESQGARPWGAAAPSQRSLKALAKIRVLGAGYTIPEALEELRTRFDDCPGLDAETYPALLTSLLLRRPKEPLDSVRAVVNRYLSGNALPEALRCLFRKQEAETRGDAAAAERWGREGLAAIGGLQSGNDVYRFLLAPVDQGHGLNSELNAAFREDAGGESRAGYLKLIGKLLTPSTLP